MAIIFMFWMRVNDAGVFLISIDVVVDFLAAVVTAVNIMICPFFDCLWWMGGSGLKRVLAFLLISYLYIIKL